MPRKRAPYIFIAVLVIILMFIIGFRAGQSVEKTNKDISILLSLPPTRMPEPTAKPLAFTVLATAGCGTSLLYPNTLTLTAESTQGAEFVEKNRTVLSISCVPWSKPQPTSIPGAPAGTIAGRQVAVTEKKDGYIVFQIKHPTKSILITVKASEDLVPFIEQNLSLVK